MSSESRIVSSERVVNAAPEVIFEFIADPAAQPGWDGNNNLRDAPEGQRVRAVGDVFVMHLTRGGTRQNTIVEFEEGRRIAWRPNVPGKNPPGHLWRWELEPMADNRTLVRHTYDWSELKDRSRFPRARKTTSEWLLASIDRLAELAEGLER